MGSAPSVDAQLAQMQSALVGTHRLLAREIRKCEVLAVAARVNAENAVHDGFRRQALSYAKEAVVKEREWETHRQLLLYIGQFQTAMVRQRAQLSVNSAFAQTASVLRRVSHRMPQALFAQVLQTYNIETSQLAFRQESVQETLDDTAPDADADADEDAGADEEDAGTAARSLLSQITDAHDLRHIGALMSGGADAKGATGSRQAKKAKHDQ